MTDEIRQPLSVDAILSQCMEKLDVDTPADMLRAVFDITDRLAQYDARPAPLLTVGADGSISIRRDVTLGGVARIVESIQNIRLDRSA